MADNQSREVRKPIEKGTEVTSVKYPNGKWLVTRDEGDGVRVVEKDSDFATFFPDGTYDIIENNHGNISIKVDVDCSEALTGLKALTREARKATQAIAELDEKQSEYLPVTMDELLSDKRPKGVAEYFWEQFRDISRYTTAELTEELTKREGVVEMRAKPYEHVKVRIESENEGHGDGFIGPCRVLVVTD